MLDEAEYERWRATAAALLLVAQHDAAGDFHNASVLQSEQAAQCGLKALLHGVGAAGSARHHGLLSLAKAAEDHGGLRIEPGQREDLARLAREYLPSRYPDALPEGTPASHYGPADSTWAVAAAERIIASVDRAWQALQTAQGEDEPS